MAHQIFNLDKSEENPELEANNILLEMEWDGSLPIDIIEIYEKNGIEYEFGVDSSMQEEGTTKFRSDFDFYVFINTYNADCKDGLSGQTTKRRRQRFTLAHELAHCTLESHTDTEFQRIYSDRNNPHSEQYARIREKQANDFASFLLIPRHSFIELAEKIGWEDIVNLVEQVTDVFDVSLQVAAQHISRLASFPSITILFNKNGKPIKTPVYSNYFNSTKLFYSIDNNIPKKTGVYELLKSKKRRNAIEYNFTNTSIWFPDKKSINKNLIISETSFKNGTYGFISILKVSEKL